MRRLLVLLVFVVAACGPAAQGLSGGIKRGNLDPAAQQQHDQLVTEGDTAFAARADRAQLEAAIAKYEQAIKVDDDDWQTYEKLARSCYALADGWIFFEKDESDAGKDAYLKMLEKGYTYAERGIAAQSPQIEQRLSAGVDLKDAVALADRNTVGLMYWYSTNLGKWGNAQDITVVLRYKDRIYNMMSKVLELDREYFHGAPDRYFGAYYSVAPTFAGGDLDKSWEHFQASLKVEPKYLATYNLVAEFYAPKKKDGKLFDEMVNFVKNAPMDGIPGLEPEAAVEKRKAELLIKRKEAGDFPF
jgi:tetratricopeptide (TPR) repeat protein